MRRSQTEAKQGKRSLHGFLYEKLVSNTDSVLDDPKNLKKRKSRRRLVITMATVIAFFSVALFVLPVLAQAQLQNDTMTMVANWIMGLIAKLVIWLMEMLGWLLLFLVELLIKIVQYNNFVHSFPVRVGWPIMRDTVNMFFIIVVLVSAFATIIGYPKEFRYRDILPKLLLMAVLINFSKTLIGLMIDFSQVILLTFVNGFKQAAGGNFVQALHIAEIMRIEDSTGVIKQEGNNIIVDSSAASNASAWYMMNILVAAIFGAWIISISITLVLIMIIFFLARIIILWFLLITSPVMFFAWALPEKLKKGFKAFSENWWDRLSTALIGGPVMAFFLWLALAMAQQEGELVGAKGLYDAAPTSELTAASVSSDPGNNKIVATEIGNPEVLAQFIIMVAFMLLGVQVAVSTAKSAAGPLGGLISAIGSAGGMFGAGAAGGVMAAKLAGRGTMASGRLAGAGAMAVERRTGIGGKAAGALLGSRLGGVMPLALQTKLGKAASYQQREAKKEAGKLKEAVGDLPPELQDKVLARQSKSVVATKAQKAAALEERAKLHMSAPYQKQLEAEKLKEVENDEQFKDSSEDEKKTEARRRANEERGGVLAEAKKYGEENNFQSLVDAVNDGYEKNASLIVGVDKKRDRGAEMAANPEELKKANPRALEDSATAVGFIDRMGWMNQDGSIKAGVENTKNYKSLSGPMKSVVDAQMDNLRTSAKAREQAVNVRNGSTSADDTYNVKVDGNGKGYSVVQAGTVAAGESKSTHKGFSGRTTDAATVLGNVQNPAVKAQIQTAAQNWGHRTDAEGNSKPLEVKDMGVVVPNERVAQELASSMNAASADPNNNGLRARATNQLIENNADIDFTYNVDKETGNYRVDPATGRQDGKDAHQANLASAVSNIQSGTNVKGSIKVLTNSMAQSGGGETALTNAEALAGLNGADLKKIIASADGAAKEHLQTYLSTTLPKMVQEIENSGGATGAAQQATVDLYNKIQAPADNDMRSVNSFVRRSQVNFSS